MFPILAVSYTHLVIRFATNYMAGTEQFHSDFSEMVEAYAASVKDKYTVEFESESGDNLRDKIKTDLACLLYTSRCV